MQAIAVALSYLQSTRRHGATHRQSGLVATLGAWASLDMDVNGLSNRHVDPSFSLSLGNMQ